MFGALGDGGAVVREVVVDAAGHGQRSLGQVEGVALVRANDVVPRLGLARQSTEKTAGGRGGGGFGAFAVARVVAVRGVFGWLGGGAREDAIADDDRTEVVPPGGFAVRGEERGVGNAGSDGARERGGERARELGHLGVHRRELLAPVRGDLLAVHQPIHKLGVVDVDGKLSLGAVVALGLARHHHRGRAREERRNDRRDAAGRAKGCAGGRFQRPEIGFDRPTNDEAGPVEKSRARAPPRDSRATTHPPRRTTIWSRAPAADHHTPPRVTSVRMPPDDAWGLFGDDDDDDGGGDASVAAPASSAPVASASLLRGRAPLLVPTRRRRRLVS